MENRMDYSDDIKTIKKIMEESSRFLSLSGLSGLFAGLIALIGGAMAFFLIFESNLHLNHDYFVSLTVSQVSSVRMWLIIDSLLVLISAIGVSVFFSYRKSILKNLKIWTPVSKRMLVNVFVPLIAGGIFIIILDIEKQWQLIVPAMLVFYGLALVNAGKFTYSEVFYLGLFEISIGLASAFFPEFGLFFWCVGFGILHIVYGLMMYRKYEK
jgi:hypothetical protein